MGNGRPRTKPRRVRELGPTSIEKAANNVIAIEAPAAHVEPPGAAMPSIGSIKHGEGDCRACLFFATWDGCAAGADCRFCHLPHPHEGGRRHRLSKHKRQRLQRHFAQNYALLASSASVE